MPSFTSVIARAVRGERSRLGLTQAELGELLGWARSTIAAIEAGDRGIQAGELPAICRALGVGFADLARHADPADREALGF